VFTTIQGISMPAPLVSSSLLLLATSAALGADPSMIDTDQHALGCEHCAALKSSLLGEAPFGLMRGDERAVDSDTDVQHYALNISIVPSTHVIAGTNTITVRSEVASRVDFDVSLSDVFAVSSVTVDGTPVTFTWLTASSLRINLDRAYGVGEEFDIAIAYSGVANVGGGFGSLTWSTGGGGQPWVYTLSEPYYAYTWWPTKDVNGDKATVDLTLTIPSNLKAAANGTLISNVDNGNGTRTFSYSATNPMSPYLVCFGVGNYTFFDDVYVYGPGPSEQMPLNFALLVGSDSAANQAAWKKSKDMLPILESVYGQYPFIDEKYGIYHFGFGGGMEHQTMTGQGTTNESVTVHELGHKWWGDMVTCDTWHHIWLNEGFATYTEALWEERKTGVPNPTALKSAMAARKPMSFGNSVYVPTITDVNRIFNSNSTYNKGGWVLHMLRHRIGDAAFFQTLADYRAAHEYQTVTTSDFQDAAEGASGQDLEQFFTQWVYWTGAPTLRYALRSHLIDGQYYAEIYFRQTQSGTPYELDVDMRVSTPGGGFDRTVWTDTAQRYYLLPMPFNPTSVTPDPNGWLLYTSLSTITFAEGPPKIVSSVPSPGDVEPHGSVTQISAKFHKSVNIAGPDVFVSGANVGPVAVSVSYNGAAKQVVITPLATLFPDTYTVTIADTVTETVAGIALDGEIVGGQYPSGDGVAGGSAQFTFTVAPPACPGDVTGDGFTDVSDFNILAAHFDQNVPNGTLGDLTGDGHVDVADFNLLASDFGCGT